MAASDDKPAEVPEAASPEDAAPETEKATATLPADAAGWREYLGTLPANRLFEAVRKEKPRAHRLLAGFRPSPSLVRNPVIVSRIVEEALRDTKFAEEIGGIAPPVSSPKETTLGPDPMAAKPQAAATPPEKATTQSDDAATDLRRRVREGRAALREREARIAELEQALARTERERDTARRDAETAKAAQASAQEEAGRLRRRLRERDARHAETNTPDSPPPPADSRRKKASAGSADIVSGTPPLPPPPPPLPASLLENSLRRLIGRGKHQTAADVCREVLLAEHQEAAGGRQAEAAVVHSLYADALYGLGQETEAAEHDCRAASAYLDAGRIGAAAESLSRAATSAALLLSAAGTDAASADMIALIRRLFALARRDNQRDAAVSAFVRLRLTASPAIIARIRRLLERADRNLPALLEKAAQEAVADAPPLGPGDVVSLPGMTQGVTAAQLVRAVEQNNLGPILRARDSFIALRVTDPPLYHALVRAIAEILPAAATLITSSANPRPIVVDASNVARHNPDPNSLAPPPRLENLLRMRDYLLANAYFPVLLIADANLGYHVDNRTAYRQLVEKGAVLETQPGVSADERLITEARERGAMVVTNDRLLDWENAAWGIERRGFGIFSDRISLLHF